MVFWGLVMLCRFAVWPTRTSPLSAKATIDGVVRPPSAFSMTFAFLPSITATQEFVVPRSMPIALAMIALLLIVGHVVQRRRALRMAPMRYRVARDDRGRTRTALTCRGRRRPPLPDFSPTEIQRIRCGSGSIRTYEW